MMTTTKRAFLTSIAVLAAMFVWVSPAHAEIYWPPQKMPGAYTGQCLDASWDSDHGNYKAIMVTCGSAALWEISSNRANSGTPPNNYPNVQARHTGFNQCLTAIYEKRYGSINTWEWRPKLNPCNSADDRQVWAFTHPTGGYGYQMFSFASGRCLTSESWVGLIKENGCNTGLARDSWRL